MPLPPPLSPLSPLSPFPPRRHRDASLIQTRHNMWAEEIGLDDYRHAGVAELVAGCYPQGKVGVVQVAAATALWMLAVDDRYFDERPDPADTWYPAREVALMTRLLRDPAAPEPTDPIHLAVHHAANVLRERASPVQYERWSAAAVEWLVGQLCADPMPATVAMSDYRVVRHLAGGLELFTTLIDVAAGVELPTGQLRDPAVIAHTRRATGIFVFTNDLYSAPKEAARQAASLNLPVLLARDQQVELAVATDRAEMVVRAMYATFLEGDIALRQGASSELVVYLDGLRAWLAGQDAWHATTGRYREDAR